MNLDYIKEEVENLDTFHQIAILKILKSDDTCTLNENNNGVFINLTNIKKDIIIKIEKYLDYVKTQEEQLTHIEQQKQELSNEFFKDNKDIPTYKSNECV
jgi:hypothetical protein